MSNDNIIINDNARNAGTTSAVLGATSVAIGGILLAMGSPVLGGIILTISAGTLITSMIGIHDSKISIPTESPVFKVNGTIQEQLNLLDSYVNKLDNKSNSTASHYINTVARLRRLLTLPEYEDNAYEDDRNLIKTLINGTSMTSSRFSEIPDVINSNVRFLTMDDADTVKDSKENLQKIDEQLTAIDDTINKVQNHIVSNITLDVDKTTEYLKSKLGTDDPVA